MTDVVKIRRDLHKIAETAFLEWNTLSYIVSYVQKTRATMEFLPLSLFKKHQDLIEIKESIHTIAGHEINLPYVKVSFDLKKEGKHLAFRSDIDALPIQECHNNTHKPFNEGFVSDTNNTHACGHDGHMALALSLIDYIENNFDLVCKTSPFAKISFIFQAAEEGCRGASILVDSHFLDDIDYLYCYHLALGLKTNFIAPCPKKFLATFKFFLHSYGKKAHAAKPQDGISALYYIAKAISTLMDLQDLDKGNYVNFGFLECKGESNIISDLAIAKGEIRALNKDALDILIKKLYATLDEIYKDNSEGYKLIKRGMAFDIEHSPNMVHALCDVIKENNLQEDLDYCFNASEDASLLINAMQSKGKSALYFVIGANLVSAHHSSNFDFDEQGLFNGSSILKSLIFKDID